VDEQRLSGAHVRKLLREENKISQNALVTRGVRLNPYLEDPGNVPGKDFHGRPKRPHRRLGVFTEIIPKLLLQLIVEGEEGLRGVAAPDQERLPTPLIGIELRGDKAAAPQDGPWFCAPLDRGVGSPAVDASVTTAVDVPGLSSAEVTGLRSPTSATTVALSSWSRMGRSGMTRGGGASAIPTSVATGGPANESATAPAGIDAGADNKTDGLGAAAASTASPSMMAAPIGGSTWEACPMTARAARAPHRRAPCAEANQPAWRAATLAAEVSLVLRAFVGARPAEPCLRLLKEREGKFKTHSEKTKTEVSSDTYPLRGKANRACGETPRAPVSTGAAKGCPTAGFNAASTSNARGAEGAARPGDVTTTEGPTSCTVGTGTCSWGTCGSACPPEHPLGPPPLLGAGPRRPGPKRWWRQPTWVRA
jgi:hypothetical protein